MDGAEAHRRIRVTAIVHIIEARDLAGKDSNCLSDPFVRVTVAGRRQTTEIRRNQISATWNQVFTFEDIDLSMEEYESELVVLQVFDANVIFRNELIGQFSFGLSKVRSQPAPFQHQVYRKWLVLTNPQDPMKEQGYLLASVTVLGPNDVPPSHERQEDYLGNGRINQQGREERILRNPAVQRRGYNFSIKVFRGEHISITDTWNNTSDPFIVVKFNGMVARTPHQSQTTTPSWNHLLMLPVYTPCFSDTIEIQLYDYVRGQPDRLIASRRLKFTGLLGESFPPTWFNFYGKVDDENTSSGWICDVVRSAKQDIDATAYMGRVMMSLNTSLADTPQFADRPCAPIKGPKTENYVLWVDVYRGSELPSMFLGGTVMVEVQFGPSENTRQSDFCSPNNTPLLDGTTPDVFENEQNSVFFTVSGKNSTSSSTFGGGGPQPCQFREITAVLPEVSQTSNPHASSQLFDIIINVYVKGIVGGPARVGYIRIRPTDVFGFNNPPEWHPIRGLVNRKGEAITPGQLLISASFGLESEKRTRRQMVPLSGKPYQLRAYIYQAKNLNPVSNDSLASACVSVSLGGKTAVVVQSSNKKKVSSFLEMKESEDASMADKETTVIHNSLAPVWYETMVIPKVELPNTLSLAPDIEIKIRDISQSSDDYIGRVKFPPSLCTHKYWPVRKKPRWFKMTRSDLTTFRKKGTDQISNNGALIPLQNAQAVVESIDAPNETGEILIKLELVPYAERLSFPIWAHRWPRVIPCEVHLGSVGLRQIKDFGIFDSIKEPHVKVSVQSVPNMLAPITVVSNNVDRSIRERSTDPSLDSNQIIAPSNQVDSDDEDEAGNSPGAGEGAAKSQAFYRKPAFLDSMTPDGKLGERWVPFVPQVEGELRKKLTRFCEGSGEEEDMFHPNPSVNSSGVAVWTNKKKPNQEAESGDGKEEQAEEQGDEQSNPASEKINEEPIVLHMDDVEFAKIIEERERRTFIDRETLVVNLPVDPFYSPSLTIQLLDDRFFGTASVAATTVPLRDFTSYLYTDAMIKSAIKCEKMFDIPRFATSLEAKAELMDQIEKIDDDENDGWNMNAKFEVEEEASEEEKDDDGILHDANFGDSRSNQDLEENQTPEDTRGEDLGTENVFDNDSVGHGLPTMITDDTENMNNSVEEHVIRMDKMMESPKGTDGPGFLDEVEESTELIQRSSLLESSDYLKPAPFHSFKLFCGTVQNQNREMAGVFKSNVRIFPKLHQSDRLYRVIEAFRPPPESDLLTLEKGWFVKAVEQKDKESADNSIPVNIVDFSPTAVVVRSRVTHCPIDFLERVVVPYQASVATFHGLQNKVTKKTPTISLNEEHVKVRVYIVACSHLPARSFFWNSSDPYIVVKMNVPHYLKDKYQGTVLHNDRANFKSNTLDPFFGTWFEMDAMFPDISELQIEIWNANYITDDLIGLTTVDIEDRWFNSKWHELKYQRKEIKEFRPLRIPGTELTQGLVEMWVEIFKPDEAANAPIVDIRAPEAHVWELRVVLWETRRVPLLESYNSADLFLSGEVSYQGADGKVNSDQYFETDTHTNRKDGRGIFNYRMKYELECPSEFPRLKLRVWHRNILSHTALGEATIDLTSLVREAARGQKEVIDRPRRWVELSHANWSGLHRGDIDIQMSLVTMNHAKNFPVGHARDPPNENPFLPEPPRESFFAQVFRSAGSGKLICCCIVCVVILVLVLVLVFLK